MSDKTDRLLKALEANTAATERMTAAINDAADSINDFVVYMGSVEFPEDDDAGDDLSKMPTAGSA